MKKRGSNSFSSTYNIEDSDFPGKKKAGRLTIWLGALLTAAPLLLAACGNSNLDSQALEGERQYDSESLAQYKADLKTIEEALEKQGLDLEELADEAPDSVTMTPEEMEETVQQEDDGTFSFDPFVNIISADGTKLAANLFHPNAASADNRYPAIIFVNSWSLDEHEYLAQALQFAKKGYIVLSYSTRGFGFSEGKINVAGPKDMEDLDAVLDWLEDNTQVDVQNIGMAGISYGSGISLLGLANKNRVKTSVCMSGWTKLAESLYGGETPRLVWGSLLIGIGYVTGRMDPSIAHHFANMLKRENVDATYAWADARSALTYVNKINAGNKPVYLSNNFQDDLFQPNSILEFYKQVTSPKKLDLNQGMHASAELTGLIGLQNYVWDNAHDWFDYWLKGEDTGIMDDPTVTMEQKLADSRDSYSDWPAPGATTKTYYLKPRSLFKKGKLQTSPNGNTKSTKIYSGLDTLATTGVPILTSITEAHLDLPTISNVNLISRINGVVYHGPEEPTTLKIRGESSMKLRISSSRDAAHLVAYLYDVSSGGTAKLITHGTVTRHEMDREKVYDTTLRFVATSYDVPAGHKLAVAIDTFDLMYAPPTLRLYSLKFHHSGNQQMTLDIPLVP